MNWYSTAMGKDDFYSQPYMMQVQQDVTDHGLQEARDMIAATRGVIQRVQQGAPGAREELQQLVSHHDFVETMRFYEQHPNGHPDYNDSVNRELRAVFTQAQQLATGSSGNGGATQQPPRDNTMLYVGLGVGVAAIAVVAYMVLR